MSTNCICIMQLYFAVPKLKHESKFLKGKKKLFQQLKKIFQQLKNYSNICNNRAKPQTATVIDYLNKSKYHRTRAGTLARVKQVIQSVTFPNPEKGIQRRGCLALPAQK